MPWVVDGEQAHLVAGEPARLFRSRHPDYPDGGQKRLIELCVDLGDEAVYRGLARGGNHAQLVPEGRFERNTGLVTRHQNGALAQFAARDGHDVG